MNKCLRCGGFLVVAQDQWGRRIYCWMCGRDDNIIVGPTLQLRQRSIKRSEGYHYRPAVKERLKEREHASNS